MGRERPWEIDRFKQERSGGGRGSVGQGLYKGRSGGRTDKVAGGRGSLFGAIVRFTLSRSGRVTGATE